MMICNYLVGYVTESKHGTRQIHSSVISRTKPIRTSKDVEEAESGLKKDLDVERVILLSFSKLEGEI